MPAWEGARELAPAGQGVDDPIPEIGRLGILNSMLGGQVTQESLRKPSHPRCRP
ncbi:MAG: hypothetical protein AMXMBFR66_16400 [Pseudomonadota bacterium]|nr:hypothetical protein [Rubrivivax sp.]NLZ40208.1 hypothetical protein [Comamonadaceae bacterium]